MVLVLYAPADFGDDLSTANDPQIRPQTIPRPEMIPANGVAKYRKWRGHEKYMDVYLLWIHTYIQTDRQTDRHIIFVKAGLFVAA